MTTGTEYLIDVATRLSGADATNSQLDDIAAKLSASGSSAETFDAALKRVTDQLSSAKDASDAANKALSEGVSRYEQLEKAADKLAQTAEKAAAKTGGMTLDQLTASVNTASTALEQGKAKLKELQSAARAAGAVLKTEGAGASDAQRAAAEQAAIAVAHQAASVKVLGASLRDASKQLQLFNSVDDARAKADAAKAALEGEAKAVAELEAKAKAANATLLKTSATQKTLTDVQKRSQTHFQRQAESMGRLAESLGHLGPLGRVGQSLLMTGKAASSAAGSLGAARAGMLLVGLGAAAATAAVLALGAAFAVGVISIAKWGIALSEANRKVDGLSFKNQAKQFEKNIKKTFGVLNIEPFLKGLQRAVGLFDSANGSGKTLSFLFKSMFQPLVDVLPKLMLWAEAFFIGMQIGALEVYIALKPLIKQVSAFLGLNDPTTAETFDRVASAGSFAAKALIAVVAALTVTAVAVAWLAVVLAALGAVLFLAVGVYFAAFAALLYGIYKLLVITGEALVRLSLWLGGVALDAFDAFMSAMRGALDWLSNLSLLETGRNLIQGFVDGIMSGIGKVVNAMKAVSNAVLGTPAEELEIHSPSRAARRQAKHIPEGYALGIDDGVSAVNDASSNMASASLSGGAEGGASGGRVISLDNVQFNFYGVKDGASSVPALRVALMQLVNGELEQEGVGYARVV